MKTPVYLAIPNYNMARELERLLPSVVDRGYDHLYILDDGSTDASQAVCDRFKDKGVSFVATDKNNGAAATRNVILGSQTQGIVHFLDADMQLPGSGNAAEQVRTAFSWHPEAGAIGFRVYNSDGSQYAWNTFPRQRAVRDAVTYKTWQWQQKHPNKLRKLLFQKLWRNFGTFINPQDAEYSHRVGAVTECNMAVRLEDFNRVGGFDASLRFHEIHSLADKFAYLGRTIWYEPLLPAYNFNDTDVRPNRKKEFSQAVWTIRRKRLTGAYRKPA